MKYYKTENLWTAKFLCSNYRKQEVVNKLNLKVF